MTADDFAIANEKGTDRVLAVPLDGGPPEIISEILCTPFVFGKVVGCTPAGDGALRVWSHATGATVIPEGRRLRAANPAGTAILVNEADGRLARMTPTGGDRVLLIASASELTERGWASGRFYALAKEGTVVSLGDADKEPLAHANVGNVFLRSHPSMKGVVTGLKMSPGEISWIPLSTDPPVALGNWSGSRITADGTGLFLWKGQTVAYTPTDAVSPVTLSTSASLLAVSPDGERMLVELGPPKAFVVVTRAAPGDVLLKLSPDLQSQTFYDPTVDPFTRDGNHVVYRKGSEIWSHEIGGKPRLVGSNASYVRAVSGSKLLLLSSAVRLVDLATTDPPTSLVIIGPNYFALNPSMSRIAYLGAGGIVLGKPVQ